MTALFSLENALVALLVVWLDGQGLVHGSVDRSLWDQSLTATGLRSPMWLYAYEAVTQRLIPGVNDAFIAQDSYFGLLRGKRVQFLDITRGYTSISTTLRGLRNENLRLRRVREAIQGGNSEELDLVDGGADEDDVFLTQDIY